MEAIQLDLPLEVLPIKLEEYIDPIIEEIIQNYSAPGPIGHIDLNEFFAKLALKRRPDLEGKRYGVHDPDRGTPLMAVNRLAKECGFDSAMRIEVALNICKERKNQGIKKCLECPGLQLAIDDPEMQAEASADFFNILEECNPGIPIAPYGGIDEAFIGYGQSSFNFDQAFVQFGKTIETVNKKMGRKYGLSVSGCIAPNITLAKNGTNFIKEKKDVIWLSMVKVSQVKMFYPWPVEKFHMIGEKTAKRLNELGVKTVGQLASIPLPILKDWLGDARGTQLYLWSHGIDGSLVEPSPPAKSVGHSVRCKFQECEHIQGRMRMMARKVSFDLQKENLEGNKVEVKLEFIRNDKKDSISSQKILSHYFNDVEIIFKVGTDLLFPLYVEMRVVIKTDIRRVEVRVQGLRQRSQLRLL